jgi:hypothetical protein
MHGGSVEEMIPLAYVRRTNAWPRMRERCVDDICGTNSCRTALFPFDEILIDSGLSDLPVESCHNSIGQDIG